MTRTWTYEGNISSYSEDKNYRGQRIITEIELYDIDDDKKAPILLHCSPCFFDYIDDIEWNDDEEKYMRKQFIYDRTLYIREIRILNNDGKICKIIQEESERDWTARITGPKERINNRKQEAI